MIKELSPSYYDKNISMQAIYEAQGHVMEQLDTNLQRVKKNQFIPSADETTIRAWERIFSINYTPGELLPFRRERIINRLTSKPPFNLAFFMEKINSLFGEGIYSVYYDADTLKLTLEGEPEAPERLKEIYITVMGLKPANIEYIYNAIAQSLKSDSMYVYGYLGTGHAQLELTPINMISFSTVMGTSWGKASTPTMVATKDSTKQPESLPIIGTTWVKVSAPAMSQVGNPEEFRRYVG